MFSSIGFVKNLCPFPIMQKQALSLRWFIMAWNPLWLTCTTGRCCTFMCARAETIRAPLKPTVCEEGAAFFFMYKAFSGSAISDSHGIASLICGEVGFFAEGGRREQLRERGRLWEGPCVTRVVQGDREGWPEELDVTAYVGWTGQRQLCWAKMKPSLPPSL